MKSIKLALKYFQLMLHRKNLRNVWEIIFNHMKSYNKLLNNFSRNPSFHNNNNEYKNIYRNIKIYFIMNYQAYLYSLNKSIKEPKLYLTT